MKQERLPHDAAYKTLFSDPEMVASLLRDFVKEDFVRELDLATLERCSGSYVTDDLRERHSDMVWKVLWKQQPIYIHIILEFQSVPDPWMAIRILAYTALLWQDLIRNGTVRDGDRLPPVLPIVLYNGGKAWTAARSTAELLPPVGGPLGDYQPRQRYFLLEESQVPEEDLTGSEGVAALLLRLERAQQPEDILPIIDTVLARLQEPRYDRLRRAFAVWTSRIVFRRAGILESGAELTDLQEVRSMLAERVTQWKDEYIRQGVLLGRKEGISLGRKEGISIGEARGITIGRTEGAALALQDLLEARFGEVPEEVLTAVATIDDVQHLRRLMRTALQIESPEALLEEVRRDK